MIDPIPALVAGLVAGLVAEADRAILNGWLAALHERYARESRPMVVMCGCADWTGCAHPWPMTLSSSPEPRPSNPDTTAEGPAAGSADGDGASPQGSDAGSGTMVALLPGQARCPECAGVMRYHANIDTWRCGQCEAKRPGDWHP